MKSEKERLQNLDAEEFYLEIFSGTRMPINPNFTKIVMFNDMFSVETEEGKKENIEDVDVIELVKKLILSNIQNFEIMENSLGEPVRSSFNHQCSLKIEDKAYRVNRNVLKEEVKNIYDIFENELLEIVNVDKYI